MKIRSIRCILLSAPYATPGDDEVRLHLRTGTRSASLIRVDTCCGAFGIGETYAGVYAPQAVKGLVEQFEGDLLGVDALDIQAVWERAHLASRYWGRFGLSQSVIGGIEMALWDLKGRAENKPVHELLGGPCHEVLPVYASGGNTKPEPELREEMAGYLAQGFKAVKIRINNMPELDRIVDKVRICREALGDDCAMAVDAAQGLAIKPWDVAYALKVARAIEPYNILWLEEPAAVNDIKSYAAIRKDCPITVAGGETATSIHEARAYIDEHALDLFQPDASLIGGVGMLRTVADLCWEKQIPIAVHAWSGGVGMMGNYHGAFASPGCQFLEMPCVPNPLRDGLLVETPKIVGGRIKAPTAPGLGVLLPDDLETRYPYKPGTHYKVLGAYE